MSKTALEVEIENCPLEPKGERVVLTHRYDKKRKSSTGLELIPDEHEEKQRAIVLKVGPDVKDTKVGEEWMLTGMVNVFKIDSKEYMVLEEKTLICKVTK